MPKETKEEFYKRVSEYLETQLQWKSPSGDTIFVNSGDNGVLMRGPFAGYSLHELKHFIGEVEGKRVMHDPEEDNY